MNKELKPIKVNYPTFELEEDNKFKTELDKITDDAFVNANTTRTIKNIRDTLIKSLKTKYKITDKERLKEISDKLLKIHGLSESNFDFMSSFSKMIDEQNKLNDMSIDDNSNKNEKNIKGSLKEIELAIDKLIGFDMLYRTMKELYGQEEAKKLSADMYDYSLGLSDSSSILVPYCWALDASKLVTCGRDFGQLPSKPSKRVSSYIAALCETIHQMSSHLAGAIAVGTFFLDISHLLIYKQRVSLDKIRTDKETRKIIENEFQQFIHSVNFLSRNGIESPFTNVSIFDHDKLASLIDEENYGWYFPKNAKVLADNNLGGEDLKLSSEEYKEFVLDYIFEIQKLFIELFNEGDPMNGGIQYRFPVVTVNLSKKLGEDGKYHIDENNELKKYIIKKDIARYNIFTSEGTRVASCCRLLSDADMMNMSSSVNSFGGSNVSLGSHRVVTTNFVRIAYEATSYDNYLEILRDRTEKSAKILKAHRVLILKLNELGLQPFIKNGWINMDRMFSTFGILGIVEADKILKEKFNHKDFDYMADILTKFNQYSKEEASKLGFMHNQEQIPGESFAVRLATSDKMLFGNPYNLTNLYSNQFISLWEDKTIAEKINRDGQLNKLLTGGGIVHINVKSSVTPTQAEKLIDDSCEAGAEHFAINVIFSKCEDCNLVVKDNLETCPKCNSKHITHFTRIIGYFSPVESWSKVRREEDFVNRKFTEIK